MQPTKEEHFYQTLLLFLSPHNIAMIQQSEYSIKTLYFFHLIGLIAQNFFIRPLKQNKSWHHPSNIHFYIFTAPSVLFKTIAVSTVFSRNKKYNETKNSHDCVLKYSCKRYLLHLFASISRLRSERLSIS